MILAYDSMNIIDVRMKRIKSVSQGVKKLNILLKINSKNGNRILFKCK